MEKTTKDNLSEQILHKRDSVITNASIVVSALKAWLERGDSTSRKSSRNLKKGLRHAEAALRIVTSSSISNLDQNPPRQLVVGSDETDSEPELSQPVLESLPNEPIS